MNVFARNCESQRTCYPVIEASTLLFVVVMDMGYQVCFETLQTGQHSVLQSGRRLFILASRPGFPHPKFPEVSKHVLRIHLPKSSHRMRTCAPHPEDTTGDALTDLPRFDWVNPHNVIQPSNEERLDWFARSSTIEQVQILPKADYVAHDSQHYPSAPLSELRHRLRRGVQNDTLLHHITPSWFDAAIRNNKHNGIENVLTEQVCSIPMETRSVP